MGKRIGLFGGTFDPVHIGHLRGALEVAELMGFDELRLIPSARPPHRETPQVSAADRLEMVQRAVADLPPLVVDDRELKRDRPSWTIDTLESLHAELGADDSLYLLLGWDAFCGLPGWHRWEELLEHCHILVLQRPDADSEPPEALRDLLAARSIADPPWPGGADRFPLYGRRRWRFPPRRSASCWPPGARYASSYPTRCWPISMSTACTVRRTD